jgi:integrase
MSKHSLTLPNKKKTRLHIHNAPSPNLLPTVAAMVQVQRKSAMRPSEVCRMRVGDIDMSGEIWLYRPVAHKGSWRDDDEEYEREIALGKPEQAILLPYLEGKSPGQRTINVTQVYNHADKAKAIEMAKKRGS